LGGYGSGRSGGRPTIESAFRLDIDWLKAKGSIRPHARVGSLVKFSGYHYDLDVDCETCVGGPGPSWVRLRYDITDYWTDEELKIDDKIWLECSSPHFGGRRWWFVCPRTNRPVRKLYLPLGGNHFRSRHAYRLGYGSQRESWYDRAHRRSRKLHYRLGGDPADDEYPDKPKRMRWTTYNRLMDKLMAAERVADARLVVLLARWEGMKVGGQRDRT
jgi:hypothetical protein